MMRNYMNISLTELGSYFPVKATSIELETLGLFLTEIDTWFVSLIKEWALDKAEKTLSTNAHWLAKEGRAILLGDMHDETEELVFRFPQEQFLSILNQWDNLYKKKAAEILLYQEGDRIWLEEK